jgi:hypothetical protein
LHDSGSIGPRLWASIMWAAVSSEMEKAAAKKQNDFLMVGFELAHRFQL